MDDCSCIYSPDGEENDFHFPRNQTARKEHICQECNDIIPIGGKYEYVFASCDGWIFVAKTCVDCISARNAFFCEGWLYGSIWQYISNHVYEVNGEIKSECIALLTIKSRNKLLDMIQEYWNDYCDDED